MPAKSYVNANINNWSSGLSKLKQPVQFGTASSGGYTMDPVSIGIAGATAISNIIGGISQKKMQKRALAQQQKQFEEQMAFNERWNQQNFDNENKWRQYDYDWNTMSAQRQRIEDAGMNPALMMGQMSPGFSSSQAAGTGTMSAPNAQTPIVADGLAQSFSRLAGDVGSVLQSFASAGKMDQETKEIRDTLYQKIRGQMLENDQRELALTLDRMYALAERNAGLRQMTADYAKTVAEKVQAYAAGRYYDESALNQLEQSLLAKAKAKLTDKEYEQFVMLMPIVKQQAEEQVTLIQKQQKTEDSKQAANYASANNQNVQADYTKALKQTEDDLREYKITEAESDASFRDIKNALEITGMNAEQIKLYMDAYYAGGIAQVVSRAIGSMKDSHQLQLFTTEVNRIVGKILNRRSSKR